LSRRAQRRNLTLADTTPSLRGAKRRSNLPQAMPRCLWEIATAPYGCLAMTALGRSTDNPLAAGADGLSAMTQDGASA
jgi:hypothetical protein